MWIKFCKFLGEVGLWTRNKCPANGRRDMRSPFSRPTDLDLWLFNLKFVLPFTSDVVNLTWTLYIFSLYFAMLCIARFKPSQDVCLSVCPSITCRYSVQTVRVWRIFSFFFTTVLRHSTETPLTGASNTRAYEKNRDFGPIYRLNNLENKRK